MKRSTLAGITAGLIALASAFTASADQVLVPAGSVWRYLDDGSNQASGWSQPGFEDASWKLGAAELGYGDGDETSLVGFGSDANNRHITTYFRKTFTVEDPSAFSSLKLRLLRDDGAVVYLNGMEVRRDNMPAGPVSSSTLATAAVADAAEDTYYDSTLAPAFLVAGTNTLAVEIHQSAANSSDLSFNLTLIGETSQSLVHGGSSWKYLDDGSNQQSAWREPGFSDALWKEGSAELGYGDGDEATLVGFGGNTTNRYITTYFRKAFTVADPSAFLSLRLRLLRDDGAVVYLNGVEVRRDNMPTGTISHTTLASTAIGDAAEDTYYDSTVSPSLLVTGTNTLAVEIHQSAANSSDISFNLELLGMNSVSVTRGPYLQLGTPTSVSVRWRTDVPTVGRVAFGTTPGTLDTAVVENVATTEHEVALADLEPNTRYYYSIGTLSTTHASGEEYTFLTMPAPGTVQPTRVWVLGDSGTADNNARAVASAYAAFTQDTPTDVWLMLGDNAYNNGSDAEFQAAVFDMYPSFLRQTVLWSTLGNHETYASPDAAPYFQMHTFPTNGEAGGTPSGTEKYYSFDHANIHFICLDSMLSSRAVDNPATTGVNEDGAMAAWLRADLESTLQEWIIAFWHHPPYSKGSHDSDTETQLVEMRTRFLPILEAGGVDLVLAGHSHSYERSKLINGHYGTSSTWSSAMALDAGDGREAGNGAYEKPAANAANQGAVYITAGSSGKISGGPLNHPAMYISLNQLGSLVIDVHGPRLDATFLRENGAIDDAFTMLKSVPNQPPSVTLTSPTGSQSFTTGATVSLAATATDPDGTISQVAFYQDATFLGSISSPPYTLDWSPITAGTYQLIAAAQDNLGATASSTPVTIVVEDPVPPPPAAPTNLTATPGNAQVSLTWTASAGAETYSVLRSTESGTGYSILASGLATTTHTDTTAVNGTTYYYVVTASNSSGTSEYSIQDQATPLHPPPAAPTNLTATAGNAQVSLAWTASASAETYSVLRSTESGTGYSILASGLATTTHTDTAAVNGTTYYYVVTASNSGGTSAYSIQDQATPLQPPPAAPTGLTATAGNAQVSLAWTASAEAETYSVLRSTESGTGYTILASGLATTTHTDTTAVNGITYYYVVTALNTVGASTYSNEVWAAPVAPPVPPSAPTNLAATVPSKSQISLTWIDTSSSETGFKVERKQGTGKWSQIAVTGPNLPSFASTGLKANTTYTFRVRATNAAGDSAYSNEVTATTLRR